MAIHDDAVENSSVKIDPNAFSNTAKAPEQPQSRMAWTFGNNEVFGAPLSRMSASEYTQALVTKLEEIFKTANRALSYDIIPIDRDSTPSLYYSIVVIALRSAYDKGVNIAYMPLILEKTNKPADPVMKNINGVQVEITRLASDASDRFLEEIVTSYLSRYYGNIKEVAGLNVKYLPLEPMVIPRDFNPQTDTNQVTQVAITASTACGTELSIIKDGYSDINLAQMGREPNLNILVQYGRQELKDAVGNPVRSDVREIFKVVNPVRQNDFTLNSPENSTIIAEMSGFVDLIWVGEDINQFNPLAPARTNIQNYAARMIITDMDNLRAYTPGSVLLALALIDAVARDNNWVMAFRPQAVERNVIDFTDIGALGYENNFTNDPAQAGKPVNTKAPDFDLKMLGSFIYSLIKPGLVISIDVPEAGPQTWFMGLFSYAARNKGNSVSVLLNAANMLTNGAFGKAFDNSPDKSLFVDVENKVHMGYWMYKGEKRDLRDIDYIAIANYKGAKHPEAIRDWSDTFTRTSYPLEMRLAARKQMIDEITNGTAVYTGFAHRVTFSASFIQALVAGCREAGLVSTVNTPLNSDDFSSRRGVGAFVGNALVAPTHPSFVNSAAAFSGYTGGQYGVYGTRY